MNVVVVGSGYVGLVSAVGLATIGHDVVCVDQDATKVDSINAGRPHIHERGLDEALGAVAGRRLRATTDLADVLGDADLSIIAVGTPFDGERIDLRFVRAVAEEIGALLPTCRRRHTVVVQSTVVPGSTEDVVLPILEAASGLQAGRDFGVAMNPEFLREGDALVDFMEPDRVVLGGIDDSSREALAQLYAPFDTDLGRTTPSSAELIKYTSNALLATLVSFSNEIANLASTLGVDAVEVMEAIHLDKRLSPTGDDGTRVRPGVLSYLLGGCGFGGSCFGKDARALIARGDELGHEMQMLRATVRINEAQPGQMLELLHRELPDLEGARVAVLGLAFKPETSDVRESPAFPLVELLLEEGADVVVYDPLAHDEARPLLGERVTYAEDLGSAVATADAVMVVTSWDEFRAVPELVQARFPQPPVVDGRRMMPPSSVERYQGIGR